MSTYEKPLTPEQIALVEDREIDFSDIPELDDALLEADEPPQTRPHRADP